MTVPESAEAIQYVPPIPSVTITFSIKRETESAYAVLITSNVAVTTGPLPGSKLIFSGLYIMMREFAPSFTSLKSALNPAVLSVVATETKFK